MNNQSTQSTTAADLSASVPANSTLNDSATTTAVLEQPAAADAAPTESHLVSLQAIRERHRLALQEIEQTERAIVEEQNRLIAEQQKKIYDARLAKIHGLPALFEVDSVKSVLALISETLGLSPITAATKPSVKTRHITTNRGKRRAYHPPRLVPAKVKAKGKSKANPLSDQEYATIYHAMKEPKRDVSAIARMTGRSRQTVYSVMDGTDMARVRNGDKVNGSGQKAVAAGR